jgi:hypothetical protein
VVISRIDEPEAIPREMSSRSASVSVNGERRRVRDRGEDAVKHGKETIAQSKEQIATAIDVGQETYNREKSKAHVS